MEEFNFTLSFYNRGDLKTRYHSLDFQERKRVIKATKEAFISELESVEDSKKTKKKAKKQD